MSYGTTVDALVSRVRRDVQITTRPTIGVLASSISAGASTFTINESVSAGAGSVAAIGTELFYITSASDQTFTVIGGFEGTTEAAHTAGDIVEFDPRLPKASLVDFAEEEIRSWGTRLFAIGNDTIDIGPTERSYELSTNDDVLFLLDVRGIPEGRTNRWHGDSWPRIKAQLIRDVPTSFFASGKAIQLAEYPDVVQMHVNYAAGFVFSDFDLEADLVNDCGLEPQWLEVVEAGVKWRLLTSGLLTRANWQQAGMSRDAEEVTVLDVIRSTDMARSVRDRLLAEASNELYGRWPIGGY